MTSYCVCFFSVLLLHQENQLKALNVAIDNNRIVVDAIDRIVQSLSGALSRTHKHHIEIYRIMINFRYVVILASG